MLRITSLCLEIRLLVDAVTGTLQLITGLTEPNSDHLSSLLVLNKPFDDEEDACPFRQTVKFKPADDIVVVYDDDQS